jgi:UDP-4-amino-4,6-dideoxy-N-acetyl-beta-L-altrosamine transaminase
MQSEKVWPEFKPPTQSPSSKKDYSAVRRDASQAEVENIPYGRQEISQEDIDSVVSVLQSDWLTRGPQVHLFEESVARYCNAKHGIAANSATSALHMACLALDVGPGDVVWTSPITFVASANCARYCGADVDFVDIDEYTYNMSPDALETKLHKTRDSGGKLPKVIIPVHLTGQPCDLAAIARLAEEFNFRIIEDAAHAIGARYRDQPVGNCEYSDITVFSFHPVKIITTAEGGMATTNDDQLAHRLELFRSHGVTRDPAHMTHAPDGPWYYQQTELGYNYNLTDLQAALGASQLERLDDFLSARHRLAKRYDNLLAGLPIIIPYRDPASYSSLHLYVVRVEDDRQHRHEQVFTTLRDKGIGVNLHYIPVHTQPYYRNLGFEPGQFPVAENYYRSAISLPIFHSMSNRHQDRIIATLSDALS